MASFVKDNLITGLTQILIKLKGILLIPIIINYYGEEIYGTFILLTTFSNLIFHFSLLGIDYEFRRYAPSTANKTKIQDLFYFQFLTHLILFLLVLALVGSNFETLMKYIFNTEIALSLFQYISFTFMYFTWNKFNNYFRLTNRIGIFSINQFLYPLVSIALILFFTFLTDVTTINIIFTSYIIGLIVLTLPLLVKTLKEIKFKIPKFTLNRYVYNLKLGFPLTLHYVVDFFLNSSDRYIIAFFLGSSAIAVYNPAYALGSLIIIVPKVFGIVLQPYFSKDKDKNVSSPYRKATLSIHFYLLVSIPFVAGTLFYAEPLITFLTNKELAKSAVYITPFVALGIVFYGINTVLGTILFVEKRTISIFYSNLVSIVYSVVSNIILIYLFESLLLPAINTFISYMLATIIYMRKVKGVVDFQINYRLLGPILISTLIMSLTAGVFKYTFGFDDVLWVIFFIIINIIIYSISIFLMLPDVPIKKILVASTTGLLRKG